MSRQTFSDLAQIPEDPDGDDLWITQKVVSQAPSAASFSMKSDNEKSGVSSNSSTSSRGSRAKREKQSSRQRLGRRSTRQLEYEKRCFERFAALSAEFLQQETNRRPHLISL
eukprot:TRINITY_DN68994_c0_g1_i1.p2 TRINITY_DN68994_c0_g1~~TRINITY_DN68994_c0_g1_i1.p2  ORF type:complete len:112 (+),score=15.19 TRINITY_DN68994_c0_g1_i1:113-448(+)